MSASERTRGACVFCGKEMTRGGMARHLHTCAKRLEAGLAADKSRRQQQTLYHLQVQDAWSGDFWLHLEVRGNATLKDLDEYLRDIWLECCGHLSQFEIGGVAYTQLFADSFGYRAERSMQIVIEKVFVPELVIPYEYDFGSTTELTIKVVRVRAGKALTSHPVFLMARNRFTPPACAECGQPATQLCTECRWEVEEERYAFCAEHAEEHEHADMMLPVVNSPRAGECGYVGPAEPPY